MVLRTVEHKKIIYPSRIKPELLNVGVQKEYTNVDMKNESRNWTERRCISAWKFFGGERLVKISFPADRIKKIICVSIVVRKKYVFNTPVPRQNDGCDASFYFCPEIWDKLVHSLSAEKGFSDWLHFLQDDHPKSNPLNKLVEKFQPRIQKFRSLTHRGVLL